MKIAALAAALALAGCAPGYESLGFQKPDATYQKIVITQTIRGTGGGTNQVPVFIKRFEDGGRLALCGYVLPGGTSVAKELLDAQLRSPDARFTLDSKTVGDLSFIAPTETAYDGLGARANCVRTQTPWADRLKEAPRS